MEKTIASLKAILKLHPALGTITVFLLVFLGLTVYVRSFSHPSEPLSTTTPTELSPTPAVLAASTTAMLVKSENATSSSKSSEVKKTIKLPKDSYTIALIGDSLIDTMGEHVEYLQKSLNQKYAGTVFNLYNYGIGGQNVEQGLGRFNAPFTFKERNYPPLPEIHPDIIILGSFSYNPFPQHDVEKHHRLLQSLINQARGVTPKVYLLAEIAPLKDHFGEGPGGVNWPADRANLQADHIIEQLNDTVALGKLENVPVINVFQASKVTGDYGNPAYVSSNDGIHPSTDGHIFMANIIANSLKL